MNFIRYRHFAQSAEMKSKKKKNIFGGRRLNCWVERKHSETANSFFYLGLVISM